MPNPSGTAVFYVFLVAPGFLAVATTITLAAVEREHSRFTLLVWSLVLSIVIDAISVFVFQSLVRPIRSFNQMSGLLFSPGIQVDYIFLVLILSVLIGGVGAVFILLSIPDRARQLLQSQADVVVNPRQPWANFIRETQWVRVKTSDDATFMGLISEWSRANRQKELRIEQPRILDVEEESPDFKPVGGESMLFLEDDIERVVMLTKDQRPSLLDRLSPGDGNDTDGTREKEKREDAEVQNDSSSEERDGNEPV